MGHISGRVFQPRWAMAEDADAPLPRYFFHINDEVRNEAGIELHGLDAVGKVATNSARPMVSEAVREGHEPNGRAFVVYDPTRRNGSYLPIQSSTQLDATLPICLAQGSRSGRHPIPRLTGAIGRAGALAHHAFELLLLNRFVKLLAVIEGCYHVQTRHQPPTHRNEATQDCLGAWGALRGLRAACCSGKKPSHHGEVLGGRTCQRALSAQFHWPRAHKHARNCACMPRWSRGLRSD